MANDETEKVEVASPLPLDEEIISSLLANFDCQPVLFVGSGISRRYLGAPDWEGALRNALVPLGDAAPKYEYLAQKFNDDKVAIGSEIAEVVFEWAWSDGKSQFKEELFQHPDKAIFLKSIIASQLSELVPSNISKLSKNVREEVKLLSEIRPHALITTNYDKFLETIFEGYEAIVGKGVLRYNLNSYGEIFHIHGVTDDPSTMVLVGKDYEAWHEESRYFASKLLTYFVEHPIFIFGYGLGDPNIQTVLRDIGRIVADDDGLITNVIQVVRNSNDDETVTPTEFVVGDDGRQYRIRVLNVGSLKRTFELLAARHELAHVNPALVRALAARVMKLTRKDIPNGEVEIDYSTLESISKDENALPKMLGLTVADDLNKVYPFTLSLAAEELGQKGWHSLHKLLKQIEDEKGINLRETDNKYHCNIKTGKVAGSRVHKWSHDAINLFKRLLDGREYNIEV